MKQFVFLCFKRFFCGGRLIFGPDMALLFLTSLLIGGHVIAFCTEMIRKMKDYDPVIASPILAIAVIITISVSICFHPFQSYLLCLSWMQTMSEIKNSHF